MNITIFDLTLLCSTVVFATIIIILLMLKSRQKNIILKAFQKSKDSLKAQIINDEANLRSAAGDKSTPEVAGQIAGVIAVEKDSYNTLINLFVDYHPAAIEMMPSLMSKITESYIQYMQQIMPLSSGKHNKEPKMQSDVNPRKNVIEGDPAEDEYQYEALIEQLRFEKQDYADKYKHAHKLLEKIYLTYKDKLEISGPETLTNMNLTEIGSLFEPEPIITSP